MSYKSNQDSIGTSVFFELFIEFSRGMSNGSWERGEIRSTGRGTRNKNRKEKRREGGKDRTIGRETSYRLSTTGYDLIALIFKSVFSLSWSEKRERNLSGEISRVFHFRAFEKQKKKRKEKENIGQNFDGILLNTGANRVKVNFTHTSRRRFVIQSVKQRGTPSLWSVVHRAN